MQENPLAERTIKIYLDVAETATSIQNEILAKTMLMAAYEHLSETSQTIGIKVQVRIAELLVVQNMTRQAEAVFIQSLAEMKRQCADSWLQARVYDGLSEIYMRQSQLKLARKRCEQAIRIISKVPQLDLDILSSRRRKLALIRLLQGEPMVAFTLL
jgi:hypothetical protein